MDSISHKGKIIKNSILSVTVILFLSIGQNIWLMQRKVIKIYFGSCFEGISVDYGGKGIMV